jgi:hypothetical protein
MRDRERRSIREFMEEEAKLHAAEQEAKERPIREATEQLTVTHRKLHAMTRQQVEAAVDDEVFVDPKTLGYELPQTEADTYNAEQARIFKQNHPEFYPSEKNIASVVGYLQRNRIEIVSALTFEKAVARLTEFRLLEERLAPVEVPTHTEEAQSVIVEERQPETFVGIDLSTGLERQYTPYEVDKMSSDDYRRVFKITKANLQLPSRNW